jgi:hypothetical protein
MFKLLIAASFLTFSVANAHICMWSPQQRVNEKGSVQIDHPGSHPCYLKEGPCGGVETSTPLTNLLGGREFAILFQQNLNHFYMQDPGHLIADFALNSDPKESDFFTLGKPISDYNAMNEVTQTNFTIKVTIPNIDCAGCVLRMRYVSNNPTENDRGMTFYQCADVTVTKQPEEIKAIAPKVELTKAELKNTLSCCTPSQFTMQGYETGSWRNPTQKAYYYDKEKEMFRADTNSGTGTTIKDGNFIMISNYSSGVEYYYNVNANTCMLYGLNIWNDWCYGNTNNQEYLSTILIGSDTADVWTYPGNGFTFTNVRDKCIPVGQNRPDSGETTIYFNANAGNIDVSVFDIPQACVDAEVKMVNKNLLPQSPDHHSIHH